jgi:hypothetical protein
VEEKKDSVELENEDLGMVADGESGAASNPNTTQEEPTQEASLDESQEESEDVLEEGSESTEGSSGEDSAETNETESSDSVEDEIDIPIQKRDRGIVRGLIMAIGVLCVVLIVMVVFGSVSGDEPQADQNSTQETNTTLQKPEYRFQKDDIDAKRLNKKLALLTKYEMILEEPLYKKTTTKVIKKQPSIDLNASKPNESKAELKQELVKESKTKPTQKVAKKKVVKASAIDANTSKNAVASVAEQTNKSTSVDQNTSVESITKVVAPKVQEPLVRPVATESKKIVVKKREIFEDGEFLSFVQVVTLRYKLYSEFMQRVKAVDPRAYICKDDKSRTQVFIGPLGIDEQDVLIQKLRADVADDAFVVEFTKEEFESRCKID